MELNMNYYHNYMNMMLYPTQYINDDMQYKPLKIIVSIGMIRIVGLHISILPT